MKNENIDVKRMKIKLKIINKIKCNYTV